MTDKETIQMFRDFSHKLRVGGADPRTVVLYSLSTAFAVAQGVGFSDEDFNFLLGVARAAHNEAKEIIAKEAKT